MAKRSPKSSTNPNAKKKVKVYYPVVIQNEGEEAKEEMSEAEVLYEDKLLCSKIERLAAKGLTNDEIIKTLKIGKERFYDKIKNNEYYKYALYKHREIATHEVENALFKKCTGFEYTEEQGSAIGVIMEVKKRALPDTNAIKFFLSNRRSDDWKMKVEAQQTTGADMSNIAFTIKRRSE
jgi:hypothetical protein